MKVLNAEDHTSQGTDKMWIRSLISLVLFVNVPFLNSNAKDAINLAEAEQKGNYLIDVELIKRCTYVDEALQNGSTPIILASEHGHPEIVKLLF